MNLFIAATIIFVSVVLGGCVTAPMQGESEDQVIARLGQPTHRYRDGPDQLLEYMRGPWGQYTYMARLDRDGKLVSYEQVLTSEKFASIKIDAATKNDVLRTIGAPSDTAYFPRTDLEVWSYPYKESGAWDSIMHVHFDRTGIVRKMINGPDPRRDPDTRWPFGMMLR